ncbi:MAG: cell division protein ZapE [Rhodospirillaceae bacterium]|jgi:cell division protein ZapE|nr:cell division protein ZapE [Rhodospirillaceae bacterium]MBT5374778.1 cell division protein ZapE [Rhodospirillaceae bacterium]MBT5658582.1 cell division protein ZapE [Rhodospirillaceae bacterium]MBT5753220.1 cell division protein ZapE [Rhodospirillaceae bacterium]
MKKEFLEVFAAIREAGEIKHDPAQVRVAEVLQNLYEGMKTYSLPSSRRFWQFHKRTKSTPPKGVYICGDVGRGKSMLMDMFLAMAPERRKERIHFLDFMRDVHADFHRLKAVRDPLPRIARKIAAKYTLICFDEFQVTNIADAMILGRLFTALFDLGVIVVATSNRDPDDLYANGLQRDRFLPFIALLKERLTICHLDSNIDYRRDKIHGLKVYHTPLSTESAHALDDAFAELTEGKRGHQEKLNLQGRKLKVPMAGAGVARFSFAELCQQPLGPNDYLALAKRYHTLILSGIPRMDSEQRNEAQRFLVLIDSLYEHGVNLICSAEVPPESIYVKGSGSFEFARAVSRLAEMQSAEYLAHPHSSGETEH